MISAMKAVIWDYFWRVEWASQHIRVLTNNLRCYQDSCPCTRSQHSRRPWWIRMCAWWRSPAITQQLLHAVLMDPPAVGSTRPWGAVRVRFFQPASIMGILTAQFVQFWTIDHRNKRAITCAWDSSQWCPYMLTSLWMVLFKIRKNSDKVFVKNKHQQAANPLRFMEKTSRPLWHPDLSHNTLHTFSCIPESFFSSSLSHLQLRLNRKVLETLQRVFMYLQTFGFSNYKNRMEMSAVPVILRLTCTLSEANLLTLPQIWCMNACRNTRNTQKNTI